MNAWTGKGIIVAILLIGMPHHVAWWVLAVLASIMGTAGIITEMKGRGKP